MQERYEGSRTSPASAERHRGDAGLAWPSWAHWNGALERRYTVGVEEEVLLLSAADHSLAQSSDHVLARLSSELARHTSPETHASVIELATGIHVDAAAAVMELTALRTELARELGAMHLCAACSGTYPLECVAETRVSGSARYQLVSESMRSLARRDPTLALHVHIGVPDPEDAIRVLNALRRAVPVMLALSANSPFNQGRDTGLASTRTVIFQGFPRTGTARAFADYADYVRAIDGLIASGAIPDPSFLWWDIRLQPMLGTVEVRVMDAQSTLAGSAALIALVLSLARLELEGDPMPVGAEVGPEVLAENRLLAARDGMNARLIDHTGRELVPVRRLIDDLVERCGPHAASLGCFGELGQIRRLVAANGAKCQRAWAAESGLAELLPRLAERFAAPGGRLGSPQYLSPAC